MALTPAMPWTTAAGKHKKSWTGAGSWQTSNRQRIKDPYFLAEASVWNQKPQNTLCSNVHTPIRGCDSAIFSLVIKHKCVSCSSSWVSKLRVSSMGLNHLCGKTGTIRGHTSSLDDRHCPTAAHSHQYPAMVWADSIMHSHTVTEGR